MTEHNWEKISDLVKRAIAKQPRYRAGEDPQAERAILMRLHRVSWEDAIKRWPLKDYAKWRRSGL